MRSIQSKERMARSNAMWGSKKIGGVIALVAALAMTAPASALASNSSKAYSSYMYSHTYTYTAPASAPSYTSGDSVGDVSWSDVSWSDSVY